MRLGLLGARGDRRGLASQTMEFARHMPCERVLGIDMGDLSPYPNDWSGFDDVDVVKLSELTEDSLRRFLDGLDVVYGAECFYYDQAPRIAREMGVRTCLQSNFEFMREIVDPELPKPDLFLAPSTWCIDRWPENTVHLPFPVARDRLPFELRTEAKTFLHNAGHRAGNDRNGTKLLFESLRYVRTRMHIVVRTQSRLGNSTFKARPRHVDLEVIHSDAPSYWDLYDRGDVLIAPRRYGGQSLPLNEAASRGMPIIALDRHPENEVLASGSLVPSYEWRGVRCIPGEVQGYAARPQSLAGKLEEFVQNPEMVERLSRASDSYAESISWPGMIPRYLETFERVVAGTVAA